MSKPHKTDFMALIAGEVAPAARPEEPEGLPVVVEPEPVVTLRQRERVAPPKKPAPVRQGAGHQLSVYIEPPVYDRMRDLAHEERSQAASVDPRSSRPVAEETRRAVHQRVDQEGRLTSCDPVIQGFRVLERKSAFAHPTKLPVHQLETTPG